MGEAVKMGIGDIVEVVRGYSGMLVWQNKWVLIGLKRVGTEA